MGRFSDILGDGRERPPAPEVADADDVERYNIEWAKANGQTPPTTDKRRAYPSDDPEEAPYAKAHEDLGDNVRQRAEFPWLSDPSRGVRWDFDPIELRNLGQANTWVGMLVQSITKEIAETSWTITESTGRVETQKRLSTAPDERDAVAKELPDATAERIYDLLMNPNPDSDWYDLVEMWVGDLLEVGSLTATKAFSRTAYDDDGETLVADAEAIEPRAIQASPPEVWTKDYHDKAGILDGFWQFENNSAPGSGTTDGDRRATRGLRDPTFFDTTEVVWSDMTPRTNRRYGMPPTLLVKDFLQSLDLAITQEQQYLDRGSIPSGAWVFENWDREQVKERKQEMEQNVKGKPHKSLMFAGMEGEVKFEPMSMNFQELEFTDRMKWYARVVASAFQVPTAVVGIEPERVNYNTFQGERENFESNTLGPYLQKLERVINDQIIKPHWGSDYRFEFLPGMSESTRKMISERVTREFNAGVRRRNEARREIGLEEVDDEFDGFQDEVVDDTSPEDAGDALDSLVASRMDDADGESVTKADPTRENHDVDPGEGVGYCENTGNEFECETMADLAGDCPHCGDPISYIDEDDLDKSAGDTGNGSDAVAKDEPLRETDEWYQFDVQPGEVESLTDDIADDVQALFDRVLNDGEIQAIIDRLAADDNATEKSLAALSRRLRDLLSGSDVAEAIADALQQHTASAVEEALESAVSEAGDDVDIDVQRITDQLHDREVSFADEFADRMAEDIRETVGDGWAEGKNSREIAQDIADRGDMSAGWDGAEKIARQELQIATGEARSEVAAELDKVEVWQTTGGADGDGRNRDAHLDMHGKWKRPGESWEVDYSAEGRGVRTESVPGDSEPGIGCRCQVLLRDIETVDDSDHAGV